MIFIIIAVIYVIFCGIIWIMSLYSARSSKPSTMYVGGNDSTPAEFPYRKYELEPYVMNKLQTLLTAKPDVKKLKWILSDGKVVKKLDKNIYYLIDTVISSSLNQHWDYDKIIDYYSEHARIKTPGYGEKYSVYEYWNNKELHIRWKNKNSKSDREALYENITEARPAYASVSISLYHALSLLYPKNKKHCILDIAAYGERAIGAANLNYEYHGVDPNYDLVDGHSKLMMDILVLKPEANIKFYYIGLENFKSIRKYTMITYSPPPFNTEPYSGNKEAQTYNKYHTFLEYFCCFLTEIIYKASQVIVENGVFSFTALDRNPERFPIRIDKKYMSDYTTLIYVEPLLLLVSCMGFSYHGAIGLSVGNKPAQVPWWTYIYTKKYEDKYIRLLKDNYSDIFDRIGSRLLINADTVLLNEFRFVDEYDNFHISRFIVNKLDYSEEQKIFIEICRIYIQEYICTMVSDISKIEYNKIQTILGRYLMLRSIHSTFEQPWLSNLYVDPVFPTGHSEESNVALIDNLKEKKINNAEYIVNKQKYWFGSYEATGISQLYEYVANYMLTIPVSQVKINTTVLFNKHIKITGNKEAVTILKSIPGKLQANEVLLYRKLDINIDPLIFLRYEVLSAKGHQYTRSKKRTEIIESIFGQPIIDIYASEYNNQSNRYCSIYPDVELNSYGSAFNMKLLKGAYLANPVDNPLFLKYSVEHIIHNLNEAKKNNRDLCISMAFTVWLDKNKDILTNFKLSEINDNIGIKKLNETEYIRISYILDSDKFPSIANKEQSASSSKRETVSVGIILTSLATTVLYKERLTELASSDARISISTYA